MTTNPRDMRKVNPWHHAPLTRSVVDWPGAHLDISGQGDTRVAALNILAHWDAQAQVWWAESEDVPGLVAEATAHDKLIDELRQIIPELLDLNCPGMEDRTHTLHIVSDQVEEMCRA